MKISRFLFFFLGFASVAGAQIPVWKNLPSMYAVSGVAAAGDEVWAASSGGVFSYNLISKSFKEITPTEGLSFINATSVAVESNGNVLVGEGDGKIDELDPAGNVLRTQTDISKSTALYKQVTGISLAGDTIFACTPLGVVLFSLSTFQTLDNYFHFVQSSGAAAYGVAIFAGQIYVANDSGLSVAPRSGINLSAPDLWRIIDTLGLSKGTTSVASFGGNLYAGTGAGLYVSADGLSFSAVSGIGGTVLSMDAGRSSLLVATTSGLYEVGSGQSVTSLGAGGAPLNSAVLLGDTLAACATNQGILLVGQSVQRILPPGPATNIISNMCIDSTGNLWCSTSSNDIGTAFMEYDGKSWKNYSTANTPGLPVNSYFEVSALSGNQILAGSWGKGMALISGNKISVFDTSNSPLVGIPKNTGYVLVGNAVSDPRGNIWMTNSFAFNDNILAVYSPQDSTWHTFQNIYSPPSKFIPIAIDQYGGIWTGDAQSDELNYHGLFYYNANGTLDDKTDDMSFLLTQNDGLLSNRVNSVVVDKENQVWIGTDLGLDVIYYPDPTSESLIQSVTSIYNMLDQSVNSIDYDALDNKWVATNTGVYELSKDGNTRIASYDVTNSPIPDDNVTAVTCDRKNGIVYFATAYGITSLKTGVVEPSENFSKLKVFPNPARLPVSRPIQIQGLVADSHVKVFTIDGRMVDEFDAQGGKIAYWYGTDEAGRLLPSGIYIIVAYSSDGTQSAVSKIAILHQ